MEIELCNVVKASRFRSNEDPFSFVYQLFKPIHQALRGEMEEHTLKLTHVHTQLLLQMQNEKNTQMMDERLLESHNELQSTKAALVDCHEELRKTKLDLLGKENELQKANNTLETLETKEKDFERIKTDLDAAQKELQAANNTLETKEKDLERTKKDLDAAQKELHVKESRLDKKEEEMEITKTKLNATQNELQEIKTTLLVKKKELADLAHKAKANVKKEQQIKFLHQYIQKLFQNSSQISETFAFLHFDTKEDEKTVEAAFQSLKEKEPILLFDPIQPIEIGVELELPKLSPLVEQLGKEINERNGYTNKFQLLLKKMENGKIYPIDDKQLIFKLHLPNDHHKFYIHHHNDINSVAEQNRTVINLQNDQLVVLNNATKKKDYRIFIQIPDYNNVNSQTYLYPENKKAEKLVLKIYWNNDVNMFGFKTSTNEVLFQIIKNV